MSQTIEQARAKYAQEEVNKLDGLDGLNKEEKKNFVSYASSLPAMIHMNGLGQAMAFTKSKGSGKKDDKKTSHNALYSIVSDWLCKDPQVYAQHDDILKGITQQNMQDYQLAQIETLLLMGWVKKFAKAFLADEDTE